MTDLQDDVQVKDDRPRQESLKWGVEYKIEKYDSEEDYKNGIIAEVLKERDNLGVYGGYSALWHRLTSSGGSVTVYDNTNAHIGVGDSSTAAALAQTDLQAASNKLRKVMDATYPQHTDGTGSSNASVVFRATFASGDANFAWNEWAIFNHATAGRMLNRKVFTGGTKASGAVWVFTVTLSNP